MTTYPPANFGALLLGGIAGGVVVALQWTVLAFVGAVQDGESASHLALFVFMPLLTGLYVVPGFVAGFGVIGWPAWVLLHHVGLRSGSSAAVSGAVSGALVGVATTAPFDSPSFASLAWAILPGMTAALTVWWHAYPRPRPKPRPGPPS